MICIVIPALNEEARLRNVLPLIPPRLRGHEVSVVVVSDGSTDHTVEVAKENRAVVVALPVSGGKGVALRAGVDRATAIGFDYLVTMDGDGQHDPADLHRLVRPVLVDDFDAAFGSRYLSDPRRGNTPINRFLVKGVTAAYLKQKTGISLTDPFCGYRCFSRAALSSIAFEGNHYEGELEAIFDAAIHGLRIAEVPVRRIYSHQTSKMGNHGGRFRGRMWVLRQYLSTTRRKSRGLQTEWRGHGRVPENETSSRGLPGAGSEEKGTSVESKDGFQSGG
jgi:glycosyltransferase involved in cell wall biosynthesis